MGIYDRDYGRSERTPWDRIENPRSMLIVLIVINVIVYVLQLLFMHSVQSTTADGLEVLNTGKQSYIDEIFAVRGVSLVRPWLWFQTLTYGFLHNTGNIFHLVFNMFLLFVFGRPIEQRLGGQEFLKTYLAAIIFGGIVAMISPWILSAFMPAASVHSMTLGASGGVVAMIVIFACFFPNQELLFMFVFPMKAWVLASLVVVMDLLGAAGLAGSATAFDVHLAGALFGFLYVKRRWDFQWIDLTRLADLPGQLQLRSRRAKLKIHDPERKIREEEREADRILAKIHQSGESSLTARERRTLERYSRRKRQSRET
ncbi:rhomboid family intramembrane serine protease [Aporhodopirellula aestuarii]|uniref:Rhomboid family intramembrane serine protease n=1 Tax=Aporhodopirellula aestuarii TaxID=2950107 RepID=A0ABT0U675_9BACT|nr:rhomboid family intramembrane serine protease [Aporhodopirellula aestuarii]MCM2372421.1 rhomboid family intramembrane serine protease [Aporhodopirellula aestuarii]